MGLAKSLNYFLYLIAFMYIAYIDASGRPEKEYDPKESFVLASLIAHESQWVYIDNKVKEIKLKHFPRLPHENIELHAKDMLNRDGVFKGLDWNKIYAIFDDIFGFLTDNKTDICIISVVILKPKMYNGKDIEKWAYRLLIERVNKFLEKNNEQAILAGMGPQYGIMIVDSCGIGPDSKLRKKIIGMLKEGTYYSKLTYLIEDPLFTDSKWRNLSQLTDCVAYAIRKHIRNPSSPSFHDKNWERYYKMIWNKLDKNKRGKVEGCGIKIFP
jgi:hypothetical protein